MACARATGDRHPTVPVPRGLRRRQGAERGVTRVDRAVEAALPLHDDRTIGLDLADDSAIAGPKVGIGVRDELDHAADPHTRRNSGSEETSADCIHVLVLRVESTLVLPRTVESSYPFGQERVRGVANGKTRRRLIRTRRLRMCRRRACPRRPCNDTHETIASGTSGRVAGRPTSKSRGRLRGLFTPSDAADAVADLIAERGKELEERSAQIRSAVEQLERREERARELHYRVEQILRDGAAELDLRQAELSVRSAELATRETAVEQAEAEVEDRRRALGAVELRAAAIEHREEALRLRETELEHRAAELAELARELDELGRTIAEAGPVSLREDEHVVIAASDRYRLVVRAGPVPDEGVLVELDDGAYRCVRVTTSPLPGDDRPCALLEPVPGE